MNAGWVWAVGVFAFCAGGLFEAVVFHEVPTSWDEGFKAGYAQALQDTGAADPWSFGSLWVVGAAAAVVAVVGAGSWVVGRLRDRRRDVAEVRSDEELWRR